MEGQDIGKSFWITFEEYVGWNVQKAIEEGKYIIQQQDLARNMILLERSPDGGKKDVE